MKNKKTLSTNDIIWLVSKITYILETSITTTQGELYCWDMWNNNNDYNGEVILNTKTREIEIIDCFIDLKTNYALEGIAAICGLKVEDYYTSK
jgi:hypothetical protein